MKKFLVIVLIYSFSAAANKNISDLSLSKQNEIYFKMLQVAASYAIATNSVIKDLELILKDDDLMNSDDIAALFEQYEFLLDESLDENRFSKGRENHTLSWLKNSHLQLRELAILLSTRISFATPQDFEEKLNPFLSQKNIYSEEGFQITLAPTSRVYCNVEILQYDDMKEVQAIETCV